MLNVEKTRIDKVLANDKLQPVITSLGAPVSGASSILRSCGTTR
jgi:DNA gyrase subunit B